MTNLIDTKVQKYFGLGLVFLLLIGTDQLVKFYTVEPFRNYNFTFSLPLPAWAMFLIYAVVLLFMSQYLWQQKLNLSNKEVFAWLLIFSGAVSNIGERILFGYVKDFIYITFKQWTGIYNLADGYILLGIFILLLNGILQKYDSERSSIK